MPVVLCPFIPLWSRLLMLFCHLSSCILWIVDLFSSSNTLKHSSPSSSSSNNNNNNAGSYNSRPPCMRWFIRGSRSNNASKSGSRWSANETSISRETGRRFSAPVCWIVLHRRWRQAAVCQVEIFRHLSRLQDGRRGQHRHQRRTRAQNLLQRNLWCCPCRCLDLPQGTRIRAVVGRLRRQRRLHLHLHSRILAPQGRRPSPLGRYRTPRYPQVSQTFVLNGQAWIWRVRNRRLLNIRIRSLIWRRRRGSCNCSRNRKRSFHRR